MNLESYQLVNGLQLLILHRKRKLDYTERTSSFYVKYIWKKKSFSLKLHLGLFSLIMNQIHSGFVELGKDVQSLTEENSLLTLLPPKSGPILYTQLLIISFYCLKHLWSSAYLKHVFKVLPISLKLQNTTV